MKPTKFRRKPVVMEAIQYTGGIMGFHAIHEFVGKALIPYILDPSKGDLGIETLEGVMNVSVGDWIVKGVKGEFWPVKPDIFAQTYEPVFEEREEG